ncbi:MAG TPA: RpiB/LacA/LacB family sugar-phosphate isomerase [Candidatus Saccharimonadia bacterium]|nr:RpiB/LacA/LacB family sugar-phosphate isomerase [Candidatus Saccharimonadia bacterium]
MIYLGADHGGFQHKEAIKKWLESVGQQFEDVGAASLDPADDYPKFAFAVAKKVAADQQGIGIVLCRSGGGMAIAANRVKGVRAVDCLNTESVLHAREHNDANVLSLPADSMSEQDAIAMVKLFLETKFSGDDRHKRRIAELDA